MSRGQYIGYNYRLPQEQVKPAGQPAPAQAESQINMPKELQTPLSGLQYTDKLTREVYDKYYALQSFAQQMNDLGIDVTRPDTTSEESMQMHRIFQKGLADVMYSADILKNSQGMYEDLTQQRNAGNVRLNDDFDPTAQPMATVDPRRASTSTKDSGIVKMARLNAQGPIRNAAQYQRSMQTWQEGMDELNRLYEQGELSAPYYEAEIRKMNQLKPRREYNSAELDDQGPQPQKGSNLELVRRVVNLFNGTMTEDAKPGRLDPETGRQLLESTAFQGDYPGDRVVSKILVDPQGDGQEAVIEFEDGSTERTTASAFIQNFMQENTRVGDAEETFNDARARGLTDESGNFLPEAFINPNAGKIKEGYRRVTEETSNKGIVARETLVKAIDKYLEDTKDSIWSMLTPDNFRRGLTIPTVLGDLKILTKDTGDDAQFILQNGKQLNEELPDDETMLNKDELVELLTSSLGALDVLIENDQFKNLDTGETEEEKQLKELIKNPKKADTTNSGTDSVQLDIIEDFSELPELE